MNWKVKALLQKILSKTKLGDSFNHIPVTLNKNYHKNVTIYQTYECLRKFSHSNINLSSKKIALEIGTGYSLIASTVLSLLGFYEIITVDITRDIKFSTFKKQIKHLKSVELIKNIIPNSVLTEKEILEKIEILQQAKTLDIVFDILKIEYVAPYTLADIKNYSHKFDYITSQVVLEHIPPTIINEIFKFIKETLAEKETSVHTINFIDHYANPGFFQDKKISEFNFLRYSDKYWNFWSGNPIAYTNRLSFLFYLELCKKHNLKVIDFIGENYRERKELNHKLIHSDILKKYSSTTNVEDLTRFQRGTLIISN
ncbi:hypothetical protein CJ739_367 [Mariniflexile rhizosphaerae]|uniref:hypothetical protein n=1 Tax=unclassified Mariniflexile TaxID=2643887 RepID=UPI000CB453C0|nr:hypothetical protein [Mariniflexile sp. TRM1-10]AXP79465.1 hypothetical protein CJ739_367 [Mariniflexile sp. TRM1-10]PLB19419.1 MAG: Methyltransferase type 11 [Flavobacteriaceae bacterium FS1-H7996/R]